MPLSAPTSHGWVQNTHVSHWPKRSEYLNMTILIRFPKPIRHSFSFAFSSVQIYYLSLPFYLQLLPCRWSLANCFPWRGGSSAGHRRYKILSISSTSVAKQERKELCKKYSWGEFVSREVHSDMTHRWINSLDSLRSCQSRAFESWPRMIIRVWRGTKICIDHHGRRTLQQAPPLSLRVSVSNNHSAIQ